MPGHNLPALGRQRPGLAPSSEKADGTASRATGFPGQYIPADHVLARWQAVP